MLKDFLQYLQEQIGQPYLWGGQHTKLTLENYVAVIEKKEANTGGYPDGETYAQAVIDFCKKKFDAGADTLYAYDCSGLGCYWLYNLKHLYKRDANANTMMNRCTLTDTLPKRGYWLFKLAGSKATHIGYMVSDTELIEAKGRKYGVVKTTFREKDWNRWGIPEVFKDEIIDPPTPAVRKYVRVIGGSVNVRALPGTTGKILFTAHKGAKFPLLGVAPNGWYMIDTMKKDGYITNLEKYTKLEDATNENE